VDDALKRTAKAGPELAGALWRAQAAQLDLPVMEAPPQSLPEGLVPLLPASLARELATGPWPRKRGRCNWRRVRRRSPCSTQPTWSSSPAVR
jgi:hypothetical protein